MFQQQKQTKALFRKNITTTIRNKPALYLTLFIPQIYLSVILILVRVVPITTFPAWTEPNPPIPNGIEGSIAFFPGSNVMVNQIMNLVVNGENSLFSNASLLPIDNLSELSLILNQTYAFVQFTNTTNVDVNGLLSLDIKLRFKDKTVPSTSIHQTSPPLCRGLPQAGICPSTLYISSGFISLQETIFKAISIITNSSSSSTFTTSNFSSDNMNTNILSIQSIPQPLFTSSFVYLSTMCAIYVAIAFWPFVQRLVEPVVLEKENKLKDGMFVMGLRPFPYILSWVIYFALLGFVCTIIMAIILVAGGALPRANFFLLWLILYLYVITIVGFSFCVSSFFIKARIAVPFAIYIPMLLAALYYPLMNVGVPNALALWFASLLSPITLTLAIGQTFILDTSGVGLTFETVWVTPVGGAPGFSVGSCYVMFLVDTLLYFCLAVYFDKVVPDGSGPKLHPCYCCCRRRGVVELEEADLLVISQEEKETELLMKTRVEPLPKDARVAIEIKNLRKTYPNGTIALRGLNIQIQEGEIFGLLGHNGSGKSTFCSILSGQFFPTAGSATIFGYDVQTHFSEIRSMIGLCPQADLLFPHLSVREHLELFVGIKNGNVAEIDDYLEKFDLKDSANKAATLLSGGQKRKLSVAIALIGNSKLVILDEPTAGMDVFSRRKMWEILREHRENRVIIIASHFLDEIDTLTDRKVILSEGRVSCLGTSLFLKTNFGLGYRLFVELLDPSSSEMVSKRIHEEPVNALQESTSGFLLSFRIQSVTNIPKLLGMLDEERVILGIKSFSLNVTTLDDVFLNIEHKVDEELGENSSLLTLPQIDTTKLIPGTVKDQTICLTTLKFKQVVRLWKLYLIAILGQVLFQVIGLVTSYAPPPSQEIPTIRLVPSIEEIPVLVQNGTSIPPFVKFPSKSIDIQNITIFESLLATGGSIAGLNLLEPNTTTLFFDPQAVHSLPIYFGSILSANLENETSITFSSQPLPPVVASQPFIASNLFTPLFFGLGLSAVPIILTLDIVKDREKGIHHQLIVQGMTSMTFWYSYFLRDMSFATILLSFNTIVLVAFQIPGFGGGISILPILLLLILYYPCIFLYLYLLTFPFSKYERFQMFMTILALLFGVLPFIVIFILDIFLANKSIIMIIHFCVLFFNPFNVTSSLYFIAKILPGESYYGDPNNYSSMINLGTIIMMFGQILLFLLILYLVDSNSLSKLCRRENVKKAGKDIILVDEADMDEDVLEEKHRILNGNESENDILRSKGLTKIFSYQEKKLSLRTKWIKNYAVKDLTFGVKANETFGLLGPNGAGKSVSLKMLTGQLKPTFGDGYVDQYNITKRERKAFNSLGYCPQFDCLFEELTCREHLKLICVIKGLSEDRIQQALDAISLTNHADKMVKHLSGGMKRKLSFSLSILASPRLLILDEPSNGLDPQARRFMWEVIRSNTSNCACVITTHNMEEADALCTRIGIVAKGQLRTIGTTARLKQKYGQGYRLDLKVSSAADDSKVKEFLNMHFPGHVKLDSHEENLVFRVPIPEKLGNSFTILMKGKDEGIFKDFTFGQVTLEQVFSMIVEKQEEHNRE